MKISCLSFYFWDYKSDEIWVVLIERKGVFESSDTIGWDAQSYSRNCYFGLLFSSNHVIYCEEDK